MNGTSIGPVSLFNSHGKETGINYITWFCGKPKITTDSGDTFDLDTVDISYTPNHKILSDVTGIGIRKPFVTKIRIQLDPFIVQKIQYDPIASSQREAMFPPSTHGWVSGLRQPGPECYFLVHETDNSKYYWLNVINHTSREIIRSHIIKPFEIEILTLVNDAQFDNDMYDAIIPKDLEASKEAALSILNDDSPRWKEVAELVRDVDISPLRRKSTMRELCDQLVPSEYPPEIREEYIAFLAWTTRKTIPNRDPLTFFDQQFIATRLLGSLLMGHFQCIIDDIEPPNYVKILKDSISHKLSSPVRAIPPERESPWSIAWWRITNSFPDWRNLVIGVASNLNIEGKPVSGLPVSRNAATKSKLAWKSRLAFRQHPILLRAIPNPRVWGLTEVVYYGHAYKWPHKHLVWSAHLGSKLGKAPSFQVMFLPPAAASSVLRLRRKKANEIVWSTMNVNLSMFNPKQNEWTTSTNRILKSTTSSRTLRNLLNEFESWDGTLLPALNKKDAKIIDIASSSIYLHSLELKHHTDYLGFTKEDFKETLESYQKVGALKIVYLPPMDDLSSLFVEVKGEPNAIHSIVRAFLKYTPTTTTFIVAGGKRGFIISRLAEDDALRLIKELPIASGETNLTFEFRRIRSFNAYRNDMFQRLLDDEGKWDSDISKMLTQSRSQSDDDN